MRNGQQKRMRGRNRGGGKNLNPLSRSYESNGPDVKVRGTAAHIAERYMQLARDAQSSGDPILAEAYLQHAEHYFRIIAAAQPQFSGQSDAGSAQDEDGDADDAEFDPMPSYPQPMPPAENEGRGHQQSYRERPFQDRREERPFQARSDRPERQDRPRPEHHQNDRPSRGEGESGRFQRRERRFHDRPYQDRGQDRVNGDRGYRPQSAGPDEPQPDVEDVSLSALPSFITGNAGSGSEGEPEARFPLRNRRRRSPSLSSEADVGPEPGSESAD